MRAVIYARYSSHNQDEISIADQIAVNTRFIEMMGADLAGVYIDEARTGRNDNRDDFKRMMADAKNDIYDIVVVWNTNRLHRDMLNAFVMLAQLFSGGKDFKSATQPDLNDPENPMRLIMYAIHAWHDEEYSRGLSRDVMRGQGEKAKKGHPLGQLRYGWNIAGAHIDADGKYHPGDHYDINEREAEAVRLMYSMRSSGHAWKSIAERVRELGHLNKYGRPITDRAVSGIVGNDAYRGVYRFGDVGPIEGGIPRIVSDKEWAAAQRPRRRRYRKRVNVAPGMEFSELVVVEQGETIRHHTTWLCHCNACGREKREWSTRLTSGRARHCGCRNVSNRA